MTIQNEGRWPSRRRDECPLCLSHGPIRVTKSCHRHMLDQDGRTRAPDVQGGTVPQGAGGWGCAVPSARPPACPCVSGVAGWEGGCSGGPRPACLRRADSREDARGQSRGLGAEESGFCRQRGRGPMSWRAERLLPGRTSGPGSPDFQLMCSSLLFPLLQKRSSQL